MRKQQQECKVKKHGTNNFERLLLIFFFPNQNRPVTVTEPPKPEIQDEAPWMAIDSVLSILIVAGLVALGFGLIIICSIYIKKAISKRKNYEKLSSEESGRNSSRKYVDTSEESEFVTSDSEN